MAQSTVTLKTSMRPYAQCSPATQRHIQAAFVHWRYDTTSPTFQVWADKQAFYVTKAGQLDRRYQHCEPVWFAT